MDISAPAVTEEVPVTQEDLNNWFKMKEQLALLTQEEMTLRKRIAKHYFPNPTEGTNSVPLSAGWVMKMKHTISRKILPELLTNMMPEFKKAKIPVLDVVLNKPELSVTEYKKLTDEQRKLFDKAMEIKDGSPALEIVLPKRAS
jgi:hypothetical protein